MMDRIAAKILDRMKTADYAPVYVLQGEETYYIDLISDYVENHALSASEKGFNQLVIYGKDTNVATLLTHARRFPLMAERQVIIVREAQQILDFQHGVGGQLMLSYLTHPVLSTVLVLCYKHKTLDKRTALGKGIDKLAVSAVFNKLYPNQLPEFIHWYVKTKNRLIEEAGINMLCEYVGNNLHRLSSEIDKLLINAPKEEMITAKKIMTQVGISKEYNVFELQNALIHKNAPQAYKIARYFDHHAKKTPVIPIIAFLYSFYSRLLVASTISMANEKKLVEVLKISPFVARHYWAALQRYSPAQIINNIYHLAEADMKLKGAGEGLLSEGHVLQELIYWLMASK